MGVVRPLIRAPPRAISWPMARFCGAPGVGEGYWKPSGIGTVDTLAATVVVVIVVVSVANILVAGREILAALKTPGCYQTYLS